jgi:orotidine-5'-phosphate decarboxylase
MGNLSDKICLALDVDTTLEAMELLKELKASVGWVKIGPALFLDPQGPDLVNLAIKSGYKVFLDLKFKDIPSVVAKAAKKVVKMGVSAFTIHADGGILMIKAAVAAVNSAYFQMLADSPKELPLKPKPMIFAVTVLTSLGDDDLKNMNINCGAGYQVKTLAQLANGQGVDGIVCSPEEVAFAKDTFPNMFCVTPGLRFGGDAIDDQNRVGTPAGAYKAGSDLLVMGSSIYKNPRPKSRVLDILKSLEEVDNGI